MSNKTETKAKMPVQHNKVTWTLAVILVVVMILLMALPTSGFGIFAAIRHRNDYVFGYFGSKKIDYNENSYLKRAYENMERSYAPYINENNRESMSMFIWQQAYQNAAFMTALDYVAEEAGVSISDESVDKEIKRLLTDENGNFARDYWARLSSSEREQIRGEIRGDLTRSKVIDDLSSSFVPTAEVEALKTLDQYKDRDNDAVTNGVRNSTTSREMAALFASSLYKDNFMEVYNKRIASQMKDASETSVNEATEESIAEETENESVALENEDTSSTESSTAESTTTESVSTESTVVTAPATESTKAPVSTTPVATTTSTPALSSSTSSTPTSSVKESQTSTTDTISTSTSTATTAQNTTVVSQTASAAVSTTQTATSKPEASSTATPTSTTTSSTAPRRKPNRKPTIVDVVVVKDIEKGY